MAATVAVNFHSVHNLKQYEAVHVHRRLTVDCHPANQFLIGATVAVELTEALDATLNSLTNPKGRLARTELASSEFARAVPRLHRLIEKRLNGTRRGHRSNKHSTRFCPASGARKASAFCATRTHWSARLRGRPLAHGSPASLHSDSRIARQANVSIEVVRATYDGLFDSHGVGYLDEIVAACHERELRPGLLPGQVLRELLIELGLDTGRTCPRSMATMYASVTVAAADCHTVDYLLKEGPLSNMIGAFISLLVNVTCESWSTRTPMWSLIDSHEQIC